jgi:hypothetical protein
MTQVFEELLVTMPIASHQLPPGQWPVQGNWTIEDWERLPDDGQRYELIDEVLYMTNAPSAHISIAVQNLLACSEIIWQNNRHV